LLNASLELLGLQGQRQQQLQPNQAGHVLDPMAAAAAAQLQPFLGQIMAAVQAGHDLQFALLPTNNDPNVPATNAGQAPRVTAAQAEPAAGATDGKDSVA
jgi:hypothetical protein